jgi:hypothetical protein
MQALSSAPSLLVEVLRKVGSYFTFFQGIGSTRNGFDFA